MTSGTTVRRAEGAAIHWSTITPWAVVFAAWTVVGLLGAAQSLAQLPTPLSAVTLRRVLLVPLLDVWLWALYTPLILTAARRLQLDRRHWPRTVVLHLVGIAATVLLDVLFDRYIGHAITGRPARPFVRAVEGRIFIDSFSYAALVAVGQALRYAQLYRDRLARESALEQQLLAAENSLLRMQLDPHFLYNTLNAIAELVHHDPDGADEMVTRLGALLRASADARRASTISLGEELAFVRQYLCIMQIRLGGRLTVAIHAPEDAERAPVPPFLLQPIVENALRHGIERRAAAGRLEIDARLDGPAHDLLRIEVRDDGTAVTHDFLTRAGIGLRNTRQRLEHLYGERAGMDVRSRVPHGVVVALHLPLPAVT